MTKDEKRRAAMLLVMREAEKLFAHHGHHPDESCCEACEPLKDAISRAMEQK